MLDQPLTLTLLVGISAWLWVNYVQHIIRASAFSALAIVCAIVGYSLSADLPAWHLASFMDKASLVFGVTLMLGGAWLAIEAVHAWDEGLGAIKARKRSR